MPKENILVVEDEEDILELVSYNLTKNGYHVERVKTGEEALRLVKIQLPNLVLLDLMLPGIDGLDVCKRLKNDLRTQHIPIMMLTAKGEEADIVTGLELGADDYITKPFSPRILIARIRAVLRRKVKETTDENAVIRINQLMIDPIRHEVLSDDKLVALTYSEFRVLQYLTQRPGWVFTRQQIVEAARGENYTVTDRSVDVLMVSLRKKLGSCGKYIETVRGVGYRFKE